MVWIKHIEKVITKNWQVRKYKIDKNWKKATGRPSVWEDPKVEEKLVEMFEIDCTVSEACHAAWINETSYYNRWKDDEKFRERMRRAQDNVMIIARRAYKAWLESKDPKIQKEYVTGYVEKRDKRYKNGPDIDINITNNMTEEINLWDKSMIELEEMRKQLLSS